MPKGMSSRFQQIQQNCYYIELSSNAIVLLQHSINSAAILRKNRLRSLLPFEHTIVLA
uniref:Uncharacterized protein n=1 Tax=Arundo donax TaxID=35708 RepID=A0A0A8XNC7_ARUDO